MEYVAFRAMSDGTREEYQFLRGLEKEWARGHADRVLAAMTELEGSVDGYQVSRLTHCLQTATRAERDNADDEMVFAALVHDIGDVLSPLNHAAIAVEIVRPYVREEVTWVVEKPRYLSGLLLWTSHRPRSERAREVPGPSSGSIPVPISANTGTRPSFDPDYDTLPLEHFAPLVHDVLSREAWRPAPPL